MVTLKLQNQVEENTGGRQLGNLIYILESKSKIGKEEKEEGKTK
jgi:hypothetical protein